MTDAGVSFFDVAEPRAVQHAEVAVSKASMGLRSMLSPSLLRPMMGLEVWQWVALPLLAVAVGVVALAFTRLTLVVVRRFSRAGASQQTVSALRSPIRLWWLGVSTRVLLPLVALPDGVEAGVLRVARVIVGLAFFWGSIRLVTVWAEGFAGSNWAQTRPGSRSLVSLAARVMRFALGGFAILAALSELGYSVTSVLAGLGLGGLALALGAQKTLENLFGAFALAVDQPFREGDFVTFESVSGTVENIGLRSTRIRTVERTVVTIPNGKLADLRVESFAPRDQLRLSFTLRVALTTTAATLKALRDALEARVLTEETIIKSTVIVRYTRLAEGWLELEVIGCFSTLDLERFRVLREQIFIDSLELLGTHQAAWGYPLMVNRTLSS